MNKSKHTLHLKKVSPRWIVSTALILIVLGVLGSWWVSQNIDREMRKELLNQTLLVEQAIDSHKIKSFTGTKADLESSDYKQLNNQLSTILKTKNHCRYIYLLGRKPNGSVFFYLDTDDLDKALPGEIYNEASKELKAIFDNGIPFVEGPLSDAWGTWVSSLRSVMMKQES